MKLLLNADDFGLTKSGTDAILQCVDNGPLNGVSIVPNGAAFDYAIAELARRSGLSVGIHINLVEGRPVTSPACIPLLVNHIGCFRYGFVGLWKAFTLSSKETRDALRRQIRLEVGAQIKKCFEAAGFVGSFRLDSHTHVHMIPPLFDIVLEFVNQYEISYIRIPHERLINGRMASMNGLKQILLRLLSRQAEKKLKGLDISCCRQFVGILYSGHMHQVDLSLIFDRFAGEQGIVEVLFHPGGAVPEEVSLPDVCFKSFYLSPARSKEASALQALKDALKQGRFGW
jgi:predicted glycoside hydrolase/deacetylase ChbG (UPF0249 family)